MAKQRLLIIGLGWIGKHRLIRTSRRGGPKSSPAKSIVSCGRPWLIGTTLAKYRRSRFGFGRPAHGGRDLRAGPLPRAWRPWRNQGIHTLIEKPLGTSLDGIDVLGQLVERQGTVAAVAYVLRANPILSAAHEAIQSGRFGEPVQLVAVTGQHFPFYRPAYRGTYYRDRASGGGISKTP